MGKPSFIAGLERKACRDVAARAAQQEIAAMGTTDPLEPGHIKGQNPNTPERLQGEMKIGSGSRTYLALALVMMLLGIGMAFLALY